MLSTSWLKNPFVLAFIVGVVSLTIYRQVALSSRRAPPPLASGKSWQLLDEKGELYGSKELAGRFYIVAALDRTCFQSNDDRISFALTELPKRFTLEDPISFIVLHTPEQTGSWPGWKSLKGGMQELDEVICHRLFIPADRCLTKAQRAKPHTVADLCDNTLLLDASGNLRGYFNMSTVGLAHLVNSVRFLMLQKSL